ncbi:hypothetical protein DLAC_08272 [Tieghemostelium lacteum]|uniref:GCK domain-containing protein n=1 Tax=Tieghemostelium lacteum TaxID=361077 RepID=A0A151ZBK6_TIELA|nr:hypothetical protein DLAC_08272 [Tieghemostelium lacteum]|eukprot:KYQ91326.1 hypothetical protein DLAC_08272 [Tieghemostelium lacteum]
MSSLSVDHFKENKDIRVWVTPSETKPLPSRADEASCPPCIKSMSKGPCGDELIESFLCFQKETQNVSKCSESFTILRECMYKYPLKYYDPLFKT